jgi:hypothetical protein
MFNPVVEVAISTVAAEPKPMVPPGAVVPIPIRVLEVSRFSSPDSILRAVVEELARSMVEALVMVMASALKVALSSTPEPMVVLPLMVKSPEAVRVEEKRPVPTTSRVVPGAVVPIPIWAAVSQIEEEVREEPPSKRAI